MIKLETNYGSNFYDSTFYFRTLNDCNEFLYVFKDHWCNLRWKKPVEISDDIKLTSFERKELDRNPKERAEAELSWGFNLSRDFGDDKLRPDQQACLDKLMKEL